MKHGHSNLKLMLDHLHVETFQPEDPVFPRHPVFYMDPGVTAGESTCIQYTCNACTFSCHC